MQLFPLNLLIYRNFFALLLSFPSAASLVTFLNIYTKFSRRETFDSLMH